MKTIKSIKTQLIFTLFYYNARTPLARSPRSKSITDKADATDLFFTDFLSLGLRLYGALIYTDFYYTVDYIQFFLCSGQSAPYGRK